MAGVMLKIVPKRVFDFGNIGPTPATQVMTVAERIDISQYIDCMVALRVHAADTSGGTITFDLLGDGFTNEDPTLVFQTSSPLFSSLSISANNVVLLPYGGTVRGQYAAIRVSGNRTSANPLNATVSLDLVLRTPDNSPGPAAGR